MVASSSAEIEPPRSKDRVVRPFDWGIDWISPDADLREWVNAVMADTSAFFDPPPTTDYDFDAHTGELRFPSARCAQA